MIKYVPALMTIEDFDYACNVMGEKELRKVKGILSKKAQTIGHNIIGRFKHKLDIAFICSLSERGEVIVSVEPIGASIEEALSLHKELEMKIQAMK